MKLFSMMLAGGMILMATVAQAEQVNSISSNCQKECCVPCGCEQTVCSAQATKTNDEIPLQEPKPGSNVNNAEKAQ